MIPFSEHSDVLVRLDDDVFKFYDKLSIQNEVSFDEVLNICLRFASLIICDSIDYYCHGKE